MGNIDKRIQEAEKLGFSRVIVPQNNAKNVKKQGSVKIEFVATLSEAITKSLK